MRDKPHREYDLFNTADYIEVLKEKIPRPFIFGPIDFYDLTEEPFPVDHWYEEILSTLMNSPYIPADNILIHGFNVTAKGKTLKRGSTVLKHSRFLKNLQVYPLPPALVEPTSMEGTGQQLHEQMEEEDE